jgi:rare lipoprotein A
MTIHRKLSGFISVLLIGLWASAGCRSDRSNEQNPQQSPDQVSVPKETRHKEVGEASWYGPGFHGQETASGETFNQKQLTAAHPSLPMGTKATVTNLDNGKKVDVTINDRGPAAKEDRAIDLSSAAANKLDMKKDGTAQVKIETKSTKKTRAKTGKAKLAAKP